MAKYCNFGQQNQSQIIPIFKSLARLIDKYSNFGQKIQNRIKPIFEILGWQPRANFPILARNSKLREVDFFSILKFWILAKMQNRVESAVLVC